VRQSLPAFGGQGGSNEALVKMYKNKRTSLISILRQYEEPIIEEGAGSGDSTIRG